MRVKNLFLILVTLNVINGVQFTLTKAFAEEESIAPSDPAPDTTEPSQGEETQVIPQQEEEQPIQDAQETNPEIPTPVVEESPKEEIVQPTEQPVQPEEAPVLQESPTIEEPQQPAEELIKQPESQEAVQGESKGEKKSKGFFLFRKKEKSTEEVIEKPKNEYSELREKQRQEEKDLLERINKEKQDRIDRIKKEKTELLEKTKKEEQEAFEEEKKEKLEIQERHRKELDAIKEKQKNEEKEQKQKDLTEKTIENNIVERANEEKTKNNRIARTVVHKRNKQILKVKSAGRTIEVIGSENDPLYIVDAEVQDTRTKFLGVKNVEFKYKIKLENQTPKIINSILLVWERKIPFSETQTMAKETKVSKPITPYELRTVEYNELDSKREGEFYRVKIAKVIFEDGTQWKNSL